MLGYNLKENKEEMGFINYVYRHEVEKEMFEITDCNGNSVVVTEDHSVMVRRNGTIVEVKPKDILDSDLIITFTGS